MTVLRRGLPGLRLACAARHILGAIEERRLQLPIGPAGQIHHVVGGAPRIVVHEQAALIAAAAGADLGIALEPVRGHGKADGEIVAVAQAHADRAERRAVPRALVLIVCPPSCARGHDRRASANCRAMSCRTACRLGARVAVPAVLQRQHRGVARHRLSDGRRDARKRRLFRQALGVLDGRPIGRRLGSGLADQRHGEAIDATATRVPATAMPST